MKLYIVAVAAAFMALAGCQTVPQEQYIWIRTDGQRGAGHPKLQNEFEVDKTECIGEVQKSATGAPVIYYRGLAGAIDAAMI